MTKPKTKSGVWGGPDKVPPEVRDRMNNLGSADWTMLWVEGAMWLVAKLYEEPHYGQIVAARIEAEQDRGTP
jgi:hypothetical protein